jgi:hypothetical protein
MATKDQILLEQAYTEIYQHNSTQPISESMKEGKLMVQQGKLSQEELDQIATADPTPQKKFVGWMAKQWASKQASDIDELRNSVEEWNSFSTRGKTKNKDIYGYKTFADLKQEVDHLNQSGEGISVKELESDFETVRDDEDLLVMCPHTHEASRKLGLSHFAFRDCEGGKDSAWCTTYKSPNHFNDYYYKNNVTFYYIKVRSESLREQLKSAGFGPEFTVTAVAVLDSETSGRATKAGHPTMDAYDGLDKQFTGAKLTKYLNIIGLK